jgi:ABC-type nitrate/sulfonate/bicarbonate transport system permease component
MSALRSVWRIIVPPLIVGALFVGAWELIVRLFDIKPFLLPAPSAIWTALVDNVDKVWDAMMITGSNALVGLVLGVICGVALSFVLMRFNVLNELVTPLAIALNAIPIIVLVPVFNNMFSSTTEVPRRLMVTLVVSFIVLVNVAKGLRQVSPIHMELMHSYAASKSEILRKTRIPNAVSYLFTALEDRGARRRHHGVRRRVLRREPERSGIRDHVECGRLADGRLVGVRDRRLRPRTRVLRRGRAAGAGGVAGSPTCTTSVATATITIITVTTTTTHTGPRPRGSNDMNKQRIRYLTAGLVAVALLAACGSDDDSGTESASTDAATEDTEAATEDTEAATEGTEAATEGTEAMGECDELEPVSLQLQWFTQAQFAGYFAARGPGLLRGHVPRRRRSWKAASRSCRRPSSPTATSTSPWRGSPRRSPAGKRVPTS